ncbi:MAG: 16S rRNA (cytidine(1402)-2'-O)-methyltransferase [Clostridia bacterium]|jgi:16S rRNA (cytidine1402-2'-O)-methyltransferase|nr:16S rRNA (cytidine(1402)-2'-O)-methyltransferase [Clostridiales bacterium]
MSDKGTLYICPTPIGNLEDITLRVLRVLREADLIAAEDTRRTLRLMNHYDIKAPLTSYYEHNRKKKGQHLLKLLGEGKRIALVSDAGTPGVSDPGHELIRDCIGLGIPVVSLPGPTAVMTALVASGLPTDRFFFQGFLPKAPGKRKDLLEELKYQQGTIVLYASPHGLAGLLEDCRGVLGDRRAVIARELTKRYEEYIRGTLDGLLDWAKKSKIKGEFVLMLEGASGPGEERNTPWEHMDIREHLNWNMEKGLSKKEAIAETARQRKVPKRLVYAESIEKK